MYMYMYVCAPRDLYDAMILRFEYLSLFHIYVLYVYRERVTRYIRIYVVLYIMLLIYACIALPNIEMILFRHSLNEPWAEFLV